MIANTHPIPDLDAKGLREFGLVTGGIVAGLFGLFFPWLLELTYPIWPWLVLAVLGLWALVAPSSLRPVYRGWMRVGLLLSRITTPLILGFVYFVVISPMAIVMKLMGRDPMKRKYDSSAPSYRTESRNAPRKNMENPF